MGDSRLEPVRTAAAKNLRCNDVVVLERDYFYAMQFLATGCGRALECLYRDDVLHCFNAPAKIADFGDERRPNGFLSVAHAAAVQTGCGAGEARVARLGETSRFVASLCSRNFDCIVSLPDDENTATAECEETEESKDLTAMTIAKDRLGLETGCDKISLVGQAAWIRGTERAYGFDACGKRYTCTTASGRTDCKAALGQAPAPDLAREEVEPPHRDAPIHPAVKRAQEEAKAQEQAVAPVAEPQAGRDAGTGLRRPLR